MNVGFIGLGRMGAPMARCLLRAGFPLTVHNRTERRVLPLRDFGAAVAESPVELSAEAERPVELAEDRHAKEGRA